jgi:hypothetical protein
MELVKCGYSLLYEKSRKISRDSESNCRAFLQAFCISELTFIKYIMYKRHTRMCEKSTEVVYPHA